MGHSPRRTERLRRTARTRKIGETTAHTWDTTKVVSSTTRDASPLIWPTLRRPAVSAKLIYLDQKHWVHLA